MTTAGTRSPSLPRATLLAALATRFEDEFRAHAAEARVVRAPGRVNLIGEHTDYNDGLVLPAAIDLEIRLAVVPTDDRRVEIVLLASDDRDGFALGGIGQRRGSWIDYVAGTATVLAAEGLPLRGFRAVLASTLPIASGLSSSAALELASAFALLDPPDPDRLGLDRLRLAQLCQRAENDFVGVRTGLMDQFAVTLGEADRAMLLDCRSLDYRAVRLPLADHSLVVCDTGSPRRLEASEYNTRRRQCEEAVATIAAVNPGVRALRDVDEALLDRFADRLGEPTTRRCRHVIRENDRVTAAVTAFEVGDLPEVGRLFRESHASLRDLYEVSSPELDAMVDIARRVPGVVAARMTGAGFGGCTVNLVARDAVDALQAAVSAEYPARTGLTPAVYTVDPVDGAGLVN